MKAAVFIKANQSFVVKDYPVPEKLDDNYSLIGIESSGLCGTDVHIHEGAIGMPGDIIIGHEFLGKVLKMGEGNNLDCMGRLLNIDDRVAVNIIEPCGKCILCRTGGDASCLHLGETITYLKSANIPPHFYGGFAEVNVSPTNYLQKIPSSIPTDVVAAFLCAGPTTIRGVDYAGGIVKDETVIIQGAGAVGLFATLYAKKLGAKQVIMIGSGSNALRLDLAKELGADYVLDIRKTTVEERKEKIMELTDGIGADLIIEGTGNPEAVKEGLGLLRLRGRYIWAGQYSDRGTVDIPSHLITFNALQIFGSAQFTSNDREKYFSFLEEVPDKWSAITRVITDKYKVDDVNAAFDKAESGKSIKVVFVK